MTDMERTVSGFEVEGDWSDVVEHGERITAALQTVGCSGEAFDEWNDWRPKAHERLEEDIREKTADQADLDAGPGEKVDQSPSDDLQRAGDELFDSDTDPNDNGHDAPDYVERALDSIGRKMIRPVEDAVYKRMVTTVSGLYFDNGLISAEINQMDSEYSFVVEIIDDELKDTIDEAMTQQPDRWHTETNAETDTVEASEAVDLPEASESSSGTESGANQSGCESEGDQSENSNGS